MIARAAAPLLAALALAAPAAAAPFADTTIAPDPDVLHLDARPGLLLWTHRDEDDQYRALLRRGSGRAEELPPQSSEDLEPRLGTDRGGRTVVSYRRCSDDGKCGLYVLDVATGRETPLATRPPAGCTDDHPVVAGRDLLFARTCRGSGSGVYALRGDRRRRVLARAGATMGPLDGDGRRIAYVATRAGQTWLGVVGADGRGAFTLFRAPAGTEIDAPALEAGRVTWGAIDEGEAVTAGRIYRARAARGAACGLEARRFSTDPAAAAMGMVAPAELTGVAAAGSALYYGIAETGVLRVASPAPRFTVGDSPGTRALGRGCAAGPS